MTYAVDGSGGCRSDEGCRRRVRIVGVTIAVIFTVILDAQICSCILRWIQSQHYFHSVCSCTYIMYLHARPQPLLTVGRFDDFATLIHLSIMHLLLNLSRGYSFNFRLSHNCFFKHFRNRSHRFLLVFFSFRAGINLVFCVYRK